MVKVVPRFMKQKAVTLTAQVSAKDKSFTRMFGTMMKRMITDDRSTIHRFNTRAKAVVFFLR